MKEKNIKNKLCYLFCLLILFFISCDDKSKDFDNMGIVNKEEAMDIFAEVLSNALNDKDIREFIKEEALKEIDDDYDVIYYYVKDKELINGVTFHDVVKKYAFNEAVFDYIVENNKLLTIYVPCLGESFSAFKWDCNKQIPAVAVRYDNKNRELKVFGKLGCKSLLKSKMPEFPVLVVKTNERLVDVGVKTKAGIKGLSNKDGIFAYFLDESFDNANKLQTKSVNTILRQGSDDLFLKKASIENKECIRDYIYYGIGARSGNKGVLNTNNREQIVAIEFVDADILGHINDSNDPTGDWSDGNLELSFDFIFVDKGNNPLSVQKMLSVRIDKLFDDKLNPTKTLKYVLPTPVEIFNWDLYTYGNMYKIIVSEYDPGTVIEKTVSHTSVFGTNFESSTEGSFLGVVKTGNKYSSSQTETNQATVKIQSTNNSDPLGDVIVNFFDPIYLHEKINVDICAAIGPYGPAYEYNSKSYIFNTSEDLWRFVACIERNEVAGYTDCKFCIIYDNTSYENTYMSNTGMIKLKIEPSPLLQ